MGKKAKFSGVRAKGTDRIEFEFWYNGVRYRPTLERVPSEANLRRSYKQLVDIKLRIKTGTFNFEEEFPDYRFKGVLPSADGSKNGEKEVEERKPETCNQVFDRFIAHCELRVSKDDMALSTLNGYREILDRVFRPEIGEDSFEGVIYSRLAEVVAAEPATVAARTSVVALIAAAPTIALAQPSARIRPR